MFTKELEFDPNWKIQESSIVKGYEVCNSLKAVRQCESMNYILANPNLISLSLPKAVDAYSVGQLLDVNNGRLKDTNSYFKFRELWVFKQNGKIVQEEFESHLKQYTDWQLTSVPHENRFGYPNRHGERAVESKNQEEEGWKKALVTRQSTYSHDRMIQSMQSTSKIFVDELEREKEDQIERIKLRITQIAAEDELRRRPKKDPYDMSKDVNLQVVAQIMANQTANKQEKYEDDLLRSISNKFVNNYFYTVKGIEFSKRFPSNNYTKTKFDHQILEELRQLGIHTLQEDKQLREQAAKEASAAEINQKTIKDKYGQSRGIGQSGMDGAQYSPDNQQKRSFRIKNSTTMSKVKMQEKEQIKQEKIERQKTLDYLSKMRMEYDIYGNSRKPLHPVYSMSKGSPFFELNEKAIDIEAPTDKRVKISSMSDRMYMNAPSTDEIRNEGMHQVLMRSMDKGNSHKALLDRKKLMPMSVKTDERDKDFLIYPHQIDFGTVKPGSCYKGELRLVNVNSFLQRVKLVDPIEPKFKVILSRTGSIAMGHERRVMVYFDAEHLETGEFETEFYILSKYRKYTIPIKAKIGPNVEGLTAADKKKMASNNLPPEAKAARQTKLDALFQIVEVAKEEIDVVRTKASEITGTITQDYLPKMAFDRNIEIRTDLPDPTKKKGSYKQGPIDYDADDNSGEDDDNNQGTFKTGKS